MISQRLEKLLRKYKYATANKVAQRSKATMFERELILILARRFGNVGGMQGPLKEYNTEALRALGIEEE